MEDGGAFVLLQQQQQQQEMVATAHHLPTLPSSSSQIEVAKVHTARFCTFQHFEITRCTLSLMMIHPLVGTILCCHPPAAGDLPKVPSMPARSLLMRKLVQFERLVRPQAEQQQPEQAATNQKQQVLTCPICVAACFVLAKKTCFGINMECQQMSAGAPYRYVPLCTLGGRPRHHFSYNMAGSD